MFDMDKHAVLFWFVAISLIAIVSALAGLVASVIKARRRYRRINPFLCPRCRKRCPYLFQSTALPEKVCTWCLGKETGVE